MHDKWQIQLSKIIYIVHLDEDDDDYYYEDSELIICLKNIFERSGHVYRLLNLKIYKTNKNNNNNKKINWSNNNNNNKNILESHIIVLQVKFN